MPYFIQLQGKYQKVSFDCPPPGAPGKRVLSSRGLRDAERAERKLQRLESTPNVVHQARRYTEELHRRQPIAKSQLADELGVSRVRLYQMLRLLELPKPILDYLESADSPEQREFFTERRLRPLTETKDASDQMAMFREMMESHFVRSARSEVTLCAEDGLRSSSDPNAKGNRVRHLSSDRGPGT